MFVLVSLKFLTINFYNPLPTFKNKKSPFKNSTEIFPNNYYMLRCLKNVIKLKILNNNATLYYNSKALITLNFKIT